MTCCDICGPKRDQERIQPSAPFWSSAGAPIHDCGCVPIAERGFRYGDGVFVTLARRGGRILDVDSQLQRLKRACAVTGLRIPDELRESAGLARIVSGLIQSAVKPTSEVQDGVAEDGAAEGEAAQGGVVRVQVSGGVSARGYAREELAGWALVELLAAPESRSLALAIQSEDAILPVPSLPGIKSCSALPLVLAAREARRLGAEEVIRLHEGRVTEAAAANVFWWSDGALHTPGESGALYPGVTRELVIAAAADAGLLVDADSDDPASLRAADAVFLTNSVRGLERADRLDGRDLEWPDALRSLAEAVEERRLSGATPLRAGSDTCRS